MKKNIKFPVLLLGDGKYNFEIYENEEKFSTCTTLALKKGLLINNVFIDSSGSEYKTIHAKKIKTIKHIPSILMFNPLIQVEFEISKEIKKYSLDEIQRIVLEAINKNSFMFESVWDYNKSELEAKINLAKSIQEVFTLLIMD